MARDNTKRIAELNDRLRTALGIPCSVPGMVILTRGVADLPEEQRCSILTKVKNFTDFTEDNDPYGEHDFGNFNQSEVEKVFWKIDYYADDSCTWGSEAPEDPKKSFRVLTIILAKEY